MSKKDYYFCYSKRKADHLHSKGFTPITIAMNMSTKRVFSLFYRDNEGNLEREIAIYDLQNHVKNNS